MYRWDRDLLHRAVDVQMKAMANGRKINFDFPSMSPGGPINFVVKWDYAEEIGRAREHLHTNAELEEVLDKLEKELPQDAKIEKLQGNISACEKLLGGLSHTSIRFHGPVCSKDISEFGLDREDDIFLKKMIAAVIRGRLSKAENELAELIGVQKETGEESRGEESRGEESRGDAI